MTGFEDDVKAASVSVSGGGVILYPTDTIWGLGCDALNVAALEKIYNLKRRPQNKSFIILLAEARDILQYVAAPHPDIINIVQSFAVPTTVIYDNALGFPDELVHDSGSVAIRVVNEPFCKSLIKRIGTPLVSTSANISGEPSAPTFADVSKEIVDGVDYVVKYRQDDTTPAAASRIVSINDDGSLNIIRG